MTETQRVPAPRVPFGGHADLSALILVGIVTLLIVKPWGSPATSADPTAVPRTSGAGPTTRPTPVEAGFAYDQSVFGPFEPSPEWSVWPGGFFVTLLYLTREADPSPSPEPSGKPSLATPAASPPASPGPGWPASITIGPGDHLLWLGLDTPITYSVRRAELWRVHEDGSRSAVAIVRLPTEWGPNFAVLGIPVATGSSRLAVWPQGSYEVAVTLDPSGEMRTLFVEVQTLVDPARVEPDAHPH